jgi:hypothetical protein
MEIHDVPIHGAPDIVRGLVPTIRGTRTDHYPDSR